MSPLIALSALSSHHFFGLASITFSSFSNSCSSATLTRDFFILQEINAGRYIRGARKNLGTGELRKVSRPAFVGGRLSLQAELHSHGSASGPSPTPSGAALCREIQCPRVTFLLFRLSAMPPLRALSALSSHHSIGLAIILFKFAFNSLSSRILSRRFILTKIPH